MKINRILIKLFFILLVPLTVFSQELDDFILFSNDALTLNDRVIISNDGMLGSNTYTELGCDDILKGNVIARNNMLMRDRSKVLGNITLSGVLSRHNQTEVSGSVIEYTAVASITIPESGFFTGINDLTVNPGTTVTLDPGGYKDVMVYSNATICFKNGTYNFKTLKLEPDVTVQFDCTGGTIALNVLNEFRISDRNKLILVNGSLNPLDVAIYTHQTLPLQIGTDSRIEAVITAPRAAMNVASRTIIKGKFRANKITLKPDVKVDNYAFVGPDTDGDGLPDELETKGWDITVNGTSKTVTSDPKKFDSDGDLIPDGKEYAGFDIDVRGVSRHVYTDPGQKDTDGDGIEDRDEIMYGFMDPTDEMTVSYRSDRKWRNMLLNLGTWASQPVSRHLDLSYSEPVETCILGVNMDFKDDVTSVMDTDQRIDFCIFVSPEDAARGAITLHLEFIGDEDTEDRFYNIYYTDSLEDNGYLGVALERYMGLETNSISWRLSDPDHYIVGDYYYRFSFHYDKDAGEEPRKIRMYAEYDDGRRVKIMYFCPADVGKFESPIHFNLLASGNSTQFSFLRGETPMSKPNLSSIDNIKITDFLGNPICHVGRRAFRGNAFQYELGILDQYTGSIFSCKRVDFDWIHEQSTPYSRCIVHLDEMGYDWKDLQITYDHRYYTQDYYCWQSGLAVDTAVARKNNFVRVVATNLVLCWDNAYFTIRDRVGTDVTLSFDMIFMEPDMDYAAFDGENATWRENWIIQIPDDLPVGKYTITAHCGPWTSTVADMYVICDIHSTPLTPEEIDGYCYDEDFDGTHIVIDRDKGRDMFGKFGKDDTLVFLDPYSKLVTDFSVALAEGRPPVDNEFNIRDYQRIFCSMLIEGCWPEFGCEKTLIRTKTPEDMILESGVTIDEALKGIIDPDHHTSGQCMNFAALSTAMSRSIGIPSRMVTAGYATGGTWKPNFVTCTPTSTQWKYHVWNETWLEHLATDKWYVFDSTDKISSEIGISLDRKSYGKIWVPQTFYVEIVVFDESESAFPKLNTDAYKFP